MSVLLPKIVSGHVIHQKNPEVMPKKRDEFESIAEEKSVFLERSRDSRSWAYPVSAHLNQADSYPAMAHKGHLISKCLLGGLKIPKRHF